jgi:uncharacterized protein YbjT (DUF2867 family)
MKPSILIAGATGRTGLSLVQKLWQEGVPVRAMVHSPEKKGVVERYKNVAAVVADLSDRPSLERALEGIEKAYLVSPAAQDQVALQTNFVNIAKLSGVKHIVKLSAFGTAPDSAVNLQRWHAEIEEHIRKSGLGYTFLHPHYFMENFLGSVETVRKDGALYSPLGETRFSPISVEDIAAAAAKILTDERHPWKTYVLTGPEAVTFADIARILGDVTGRRIRYVPVSYDAAKQGMVQAGMPEWLADDLIRLMKSWEEGRGGIVSGEGERLTGRKPSSVREFFRKHRSLFLAAA